MEYYAHIDEERKQTVKEHLQGTAELAKNFATEFGNGDWGYCCGMLHDIGKYSKEFQNKIQNGLDVRVDHSTAGAKVGGNISSIISYCVAGHHAGLPDTGRKGLPSSLIDRLEKKICDYSAYKKEIAIPVVKSVPFDMKQVTDFDFSLSVFIRMIYSCLVDADFLNTEDFMKNGKINRDSGESLESLLERLKVGKSKWFDNYDLASIGGRRSEILRECMKKGTLSKGLYQLTVPTGGGKTIASLAFALQHAVKNNMKRIIYVIPYTSIIEQNAKVFREILGNYNVLENHCNVDYESSEDFIPLHLAAENWDKPVVVTTNVQFFESLYANKPSKCRKLHNIANSVIIFDEAQMLPGNYLKPCVAMMEELLLNYGVSIVLCTATQPALLQFFSKSIIPTELCPRMDEQFQYFERVKYQDIGTITEEDMAQKLQNEMQALCIVNTRKRAQVLFDQLKGEGVFHLSTSMYPLHRKRVIEEIKSRIENREKCILISTSLIEAGVDLDFMSVYRELAGVDSIIQAAGRCNRNGERAKEDSIVHIFRWEDKESIPSQRQQIDVTKNLIAEGKDISNLEVVTEYFSRLYHIKGDSLDKKRILGEFRDEEYNFATVAREFNLIEENTVMVFIPKEPEAIDLLNEIEMKGITKSLMRKSGQYCVNIRRSSDGKSENLFEKMYYDGILEPVQGGGQDFYKLVRKEIYQDETGLKLDLELGQALFG